MGNPDTVIPDPCVDRRYWGKPKVEAIQELENLRTEIHINPFGVDERGVFHRPRIQQQINAILKQPNLSTLSVIERAFYFFGGNDSQKCKLNGVEFSLEELKKMVATFPDPVSSLAKKHFRMNVPFIGYMIHEYANPLNVMVAPFRTEFQFDLRWKDQMVDQSNKCRTEVWWEFQGVPVTEKAEVVVVRKRGEKAL